MSSGRYTPMKLLRPVCRNFLASAIVIAVAAGFLVLGGLPVPQPAP